MFEYADGFVSPRLGLPCAPDQNTLWENIGVTASWNWLPDQCLRGERGSYRRYAGYKEVGVGNSELKVGWHASFIVIRKATIITALMSTFFVG